MIVEGIRGQYLDGDFLMSQLGIPPEQITNSQLFMLLNSLYAQSTAHNKALLDLKVEFEDYKKEHKAMAETFRTTRNVLTAIKFLAAIGIPFAAVWAIVTKPFHA